MTLFLRAAPWALALALLAGCKFEVTGTTHHVLETPLCPVPAPIVNDPAEEPYWLPLGCPYQVRLPDGSLETRVWNGKAQGDSAP